jgi:hypothetical protein
MVTNEQHAEYGDEAIRAGTPDYGQNGDDLDALFTDAGDAVANILHKLALAAEPEMGVDAAAHFALGVLGRAQTNFEAEMGGDDLFNSGDPREEDH